MRANDNGEWSGDAIVTGAGPAGSTCAALLGGAGLRVLLIDRGPSRRWQPVEILAPATVQMLRAHRLFDASPDRGYGVCRGVFGLWRHEPAFLDYQLFACDAGIAVNRAVFDADLAARAAAAGAYVVAGTTVERAVRAPDGRWAVSLIADDGTKTTASAAVLIEAGGRSARSLAQAAGRDYADRLVGIACPLPLDPSPIQIMLLEADGDGWWYSSCDARGRGAAVYLSDADLLPRFAGERAAFFRRKFAASRLLRQHLPALPEVVDLRVVDARTSRRRSFTAHASLAIGDAAYSVDPLSGGGLRRAVEAALMAADSVTAYVVNGDQQAFDRYAAWAAADFDRWLANKNGVYASAAPDLFTRPFWQRRIAAPARLH